MLSVQRGNEAGLIEDRSPLFISWIDKLEAWTRHIYLPCCHRQDDCLGWEGRGSGVRRGPQGVCEVVSSPLRLWNSHKLVSLRLESGKVREGGCSHHLAGLICL